MRSLINSRLLHPLPFLGGALFSLATGGLLYVETSKSIEHDAEVRFADHARNAQGVISARIKSYTDLLRGAGSLFQSSNTISHQQFHEYVDGLGLDRNFPAVKVLNFTTGVRADERDEFEHSMRASLDKYLDKPSDFKITPSGERPFYSVVTYVEPAPKEARYGLDLMMNPYVGATIMETRDNGQMMASGTPIVALSGPNDIFLGMRIPIYLHGVQLDNVEQRRAAYRGSIGIAFSVSRLVQGVLGTMPIENVRMTLFDSGPRLDANGRDISAKERTLYDSKGNDKSPTPPLDNSRDMFTFTAPLDFNGRPWKTTFSVPKTELYSELDKFYPILAMAAGFISSILIYALFFTLATSRKRALKLAEQMTNELNESKRELEITHENLRQFTAHALQIKEWERKRIAREIHDELGQSLLALRIDAELLSVRTCSSHSRLHVLARATLKQIDATIKSVRQIIVDLRPNVLDLGLGAAVEWQISEFRRGTGIRCVLRGEHKDIPLNEHSTIMFFRVLQESLTNVKKHANATTVHVSLEVSEAWFTMTVTDDGCGIPSNERHKAGSFGLVGIEERMNILGGRSAIISSPGAGTTISVSVPVPDRTLSVAPSSPVTDDLHSEFV